MFSKCLDELPESGVEGGEVDFGAVLEGKGDGGFSSDGVGSPFSELIDGLGPIFLSTENLFGRAANNPFRTGHTFDFFSEINGAVFRNLSNNGLAKIGFLFL